TDVMLIAALDGPTRNLTQNFHESVGSGLTWSPDGQTIYFLNGIGMYNQVFSASVSSGKVTPLTSGNQFYGAFDLSNDGKFIAYTLSDSHTPGDIWIAPVGSEQARQITHNNPQLKDFALADTEIIKWKGPDNFEIEGVLVKPLGY